MGNYRSLYNLRIEHDYFDGNVCRAIRCRISSSEANLWRRRGLLFRQLAENEWTVLYDSTGAGVDTRSDLFLLEMEINDPSFVLYTRWDGFSPNSAYELELPPAENVVEAAQVIRETAPKRSIGSGFCQIRLKVTDGMLGTDPKKKPETCTLKFHAPEYRWEYLFIQRKDKKVAPDEVLLEETRGGLHFEPFKTAMEYGHDVLSTLSEETVPMREHYGYSLSMVSPVGDTGQKRTILKHINLPEPGRFLDAKSGQLRQVCIL